MIVARKDCCVVLESIDPLDDDVDQLRFQIAVKIGKLHEAKSLERGGQSRQDDFILHDLHVQEVSLTDLIETREFEGMPDEGIHRDYTLKLEEALALMNFPRPKACLFANSPLKQLPAHALSQLPIVGVTRGF